MDVLLLLYCVSQYMVGCEQHTARGNVVSMLKGMYHVKFAKHACRGGKASTAGTQKRNDSVDDAVELRRAVRVARVGGQGSIEAWPEDPPKKAIYLS